MFDDARITEQCAALCDAAEQAFYNTSKIALRNLKSRGSSLYVLHVRIPPFRHEILLLLDNTGDYIKQIGTTLTSALTPARQVSTAVMTDRRE